ncbi:MAG: cyclic-di-AMP receptor [Chloroflexota bacterium]|nr:cyclic-di-AMP receptor [Chloroflexota bacterium]
MKLIIAIIKDEDNDNVSKALTKEDFRVTFIASTGGFLRSGRSTLLIGVEDEQVPRALELIRKNAKKPGKSGEKRATIFVLKVDRFTQL